VSLTALNKLRAADSPDELQTILLSELVNFGSDFVAFAMADASGSMFLDGTADANGVYLKHTTLAQAHSIVPVDLFQLVLRLKKVRSRVCVLAAH
jgi:hypothetical protein